MWGLGRRAPPDSPHATPGDHARAALGALDDLAENGPVAVVAHSAGGLVATELSALAPERIGAVLGLSAVFPEDGQSSTSCLPAPQRWVLPVVMRLAGTRPPEAAVRRHLAAGADEAAVQRLLADLTPESRAYHRTPVRGRVRAERRGYVFSDDDSELPAVLQQRSAARLQPAVTEHLPGGHLPMLLHPERLQQLITRFVQRRASGSRHD